MVQLFFHNESARRAHMAMRSYARLAKQFQKATCELRELNKLMKLMPSILAEERSDFPDPDEWNKALDSYASATDELGVELIENGHLMIETAKALEFYAKYSDDL